MRSEGAARAERRATRARRARLAYIAGGSRRRSRAGAFARRGALLLLGSSLFPSVAPRARRSFAPPARRRRGARATGVRVGAYRARRDARGARGVRAPRALSRVSPRVFLIFRLFSSLRAPCRSLLRARCSSRSVARRGARSTRGASWGIRAPRPLSSRSVSVGNGGPGSWASLLVSLHRPCARCFFVRSAAAPPPPQDTTS